MAEYPRGDAYRVPLTDKDRDRLAEAHNNDIVTILDENIMITPEQADRAAREIRELREEAEKLRKLLRNTNRYQIPAPYQMPPTYREHAGWRKPDYPQDILKELQSYAQEIWDDGDAHNLISKAIVEITYLRQQQHNLPY
jgi:hypothetical protein